MYKILRENRIVIFAVAQLVDFHKITICFSLYANTFNFTMGTEDALDALDYLKPKLAIPMHYNTWPPIAQDANAFAAAAKKRGHEVNPLKPGASVSI